MKTAADSAKKFVERAGSAAGLYFEGARDTSKDQSALAVAAIPRMKTELLKAIDTGRVAKGLQASGKQGWFKGVEEKGKDRYEPGIRFSGAKYATNSGKFDSARGAAANMPTGDKGSATNLAKVSAVVAALPKVKLGV